MTSREALKDYYADLSANLGYVSQELGLGAADIDPLFTDFDEVSAIVFDEDNEMGRHIMDAFAVHLPGRRGDSMGYITQRRIGQINPFESWRGAATENKDLLHYTPLVGATAETYLADFGGAPSVLRSLLRRCHEIQTELREAVRPVFWDIEIEDLMIAPRGEEIQDVHLIRLLRYLPVERGQDIPPDSQAQLHFDRSKFTAAFWESHPGLAGAPANNALGDPNLLVDEFDTMVDRARQSPIRHRPGELKLFAGAGYNHLPADVQERTGHWKPLLHGVVNPDPHTERRAAVLFMNEHGLVTGNSVPEPEECTLEDIREEIAQRQLRHGRAVAP